MNIEIYLPGLNKPVLVSENKFGSVMDLTGVKFYEDGDGAVIFNCTLGFRCTKTIRFSRYIKDYFGPKQVDHINHNLYDNTNENLRIATPSQNNINKNKRLGCSSKYKGVSWSQVLGKWKAGIKVRGKQIHLGYFDIEEDAAKVYNVAALKYFGEFAFLNIIPE